MAQYKRIFHLFFFLALSICCFAQKTSHIDGVVRDKDTGEPLSFAQVMFVGTNIGTTSDFDGNFSLTHTQKYTVLTFRMIGYKDKKYTLPVGANRTDVVILMEPEDFQLEEVVITPNSHKREHYTRKNNPAVELLKNILSHKGQNNLEWEQDYKVQTYEKLTLALDPFDMDLRKNKFRRQFLFLENYVDTSELDSTTFLNISLRETLSDDFYKKGPKDKKTIVHAKRGVGLDFLFDHGSLNTNIEYLFNPIDIRKNEVEMLMNRFISPLSSSMGNAYYHYYIMDTLIVEDVECIDLAFVPVNSESMAFTGHLYVANDSTYAVRKCEINVSPKINMNWVKTLRVVQTFEQVPTGQWAMKESYTEVFFALQKKMKHTILGKQRRIFMNYEPGVHAPDSVFTTMQGNVYNMPGYKKKKGAEWDKLRPDTLLANELLFDSLTHELMQVKSFKGLVDAINIISEEYIPTNFKDFRASKFDFGPIWNTYSYNGIEGSRIRIGGMSTANLHPNIFFRGYVAYGFKDKLPKGQGTLVFSFNKKEYHSMESFRHAIYLMGQYDLESPGQEFAQLGRDHIFMSVDPIAWAKPERWNRKMQYVTRGRLTYEHEWPNHFSILTYAEYERNRPTPEIAYQLVDGTPRPFYQDVQWTFQLRYSPGAAIYNNRLGLELPFNLSKNAPIFRINNDFGYIFEDKLFYDRTEISAEYRLQFASFGYIDIIGKGGFVWTKAPWTKLFMMPANRSFYLNPKSFNMMGSMEFLMDRYIMLNLHYHMKGLILNRIPGINKLHLREVISFAGVWGGLSKKNNATLEGADGRLYRFPNDDTNNIMGIKTRAIDGKLPYMEFSVGIENILKVIRIDYIRRITYTKGLSGWDVNGIKITLHTEI
ncbi:MAG: carboxypeptidase-like regulatory domain-containing protein [Paludibacteraceae bacterium]|nr:carboxypeptidase-like regulatory domain-containing protein [Paludibacteraceae bacterium]